MKNGTEIQDTKKIVVDPRGGHNRYKFNERFFTKWTPKMAYVLGFLYADGNITDSIPSRTQYIKFTSIDKEILKKIKLALKSKHQIYSTPPRLVRHRNGEYLSRKSFTLRIGSRKMFSNLINIGVVTNKSKIAILPNIPVDFLNHFTRGYFDGDGCVYVEYGKEKTKKKIAKRLRIIFTSGSKRYLEELNWAISKSINAQKGGIYTGQRAFNLVYPTRTSTNLFKYMYNDANGLFLKRKYDKFQKYFKIKGIM